MSSTVRKDIPKRLATTNLYLLLNSLISAILSFGISKCKAIVMSNIIKEVSCQVFVSTNIQFLIL
jgi:hypothetical protein